MLQQTKRIKYYTGIFKFILIMIISIIAIYANAQKRIIYGYVLDSINYSPIVKARITNTNTNKTAVVNSRGIFSLTASPNDLLFFTADGYHFRTHRYGVLSQDTVIIYMAQLAHNLPGVTVSAKGYTQYQNDSMQRKEEFLKDMVRPKRKAASTAKSGAGMEINLDYFSKFQKSKRRAYELFDEYEKDAYINYRFSREIVTSYTGFTGDTLQQFINLYTPQFDWLRTHTNDEDILYYINDHLKLFYTRKEKK